MEGFEADGVGVGESGGEADVQAEVDGEGDGETCYCEQSRDSRSVSDVLLELKASE